MRLDGRHCRSFLGSDLPIQITIANFASLAFSFLTVPVIARAVGAEGRGETAAVIAAFVFVPVLLGLGIPLEVRRRSTGGIDEAVVRAARDISLLLLVPAAGVSTLLCVTVFAETSNAVRLLAAIGIATAPIGVSWSIDAGALVGAGRYRAVFLLRVTQPTLVLVLMVPAWMAGVLTPVAILVIYQIGNLSTAALGMALNRVSLRGARSRRRSLVRAGLSFAGSAVAESASARLDQIVVLPLIGAAETGYYTLAVSIAVLPIAVSHALAAKHFREMAAAPDQAAHAIARQGMRECAALVIPMSVLLGLMGLWAIPIIFGEEFQPATTVLLILVPGSVGMALSYVGSMLLAARSRGATMTASQVASLSLNMALLIPFANHMAAQGAAWASTAAYLFLVAIQLVALRVSLIVLMPTIGGFSSGLRSLVR